MPTTHILGFPRIGARRELKLALESFWRGDSTATQLYSVGADLRRQHWQWQLDAGLDLLTVGDFAWYDQVLETAVHLGAIPARFGHDAAKLDLAAFFELARGNAHQPALELTKWFDTNYHYLKPEFDDASRFDGGVRWWIDATADAARLGRPVKTVLVGPLSLLYLANYRGTGDVLGLLPRLIPAYRRLLAELAEAGASWVQLDEPILALDLPKVWLDALAPTYRALQGAGPRLLLATYFGGVEQHAELLKSLAVDGLHLDLVRAPQQLAALVADWPADKILSAGVIDGRNIWRSDLDAALDSLTPVQRQLGDALWLAPSCSLLHVPVDLAAEQRLDGELQSWLAFARQKLDELRLLKRGLELGRIAVHAQLAGQRAALESRRHSPRCHNPAVAARLAAIQPADWQRTLPYAERAVQQRERLQLPLLPTTTIGSFPQTAAIRSARAAHKRGELDVPTYRSAMQAEIRHAIERQQVLGLDMLVHGEAERNDMVEYFGEQLAGYAFTDFGWVQSYGSRCVKPPVLFGDVTRPEPMTVEWSMYAQSQTQLPVKGMLTGPVTMLQWAFVRDDLPRSTVATQIALAIRDEVVDLEAAGIAAIQIDEPAFREGLPLKRAEWEAYLDWAVRVFRLASSGVAANCQIHTHMCYSEFNDILPAIAALDADVITIETSRSAMALLDGFASFAYPNEIGPGVYDIHSPRVPSVDEMLVLLRRAASVIPAERLWVNPDCGLKTRGWPEVEAALAAMVSAARRLRAELGEEFKVGKVLKSLESDALIQAVAGGVGQVGEQEHIEPFGNQHPGCTCH